MPALVLLGAAVHLALPEGQGAGSVLGVLAASFAAPPAETVAWICLGFALFGATLATATLRFSVLLQAAGVEAPLARLWRVVLVAHFFNTVLPGGVVGDIWRVYDGHDHGRRGPAVLGVVAVERVLGLQALGLVAVGAAPFADRSLLGAELFGPVVLAAAACAFGPFVLLLPAVSRAIRGAAKAGTRAPLIARRLPRVTRVLTEMLEGLAALRRDRSRLLFALAASLVCQALPVVAVWALAQPLAGQVRPVWFAIVVPFVTLVGMLPISVGGTGVREVLFVSLFGRVGLAASAGLALGLLTGAVNLAWAVIGGALFAAGRRHAAPASPSE